MALTDRQQDLMERAVPNRGTSAEINAQIDSESAGGISDLAQQRLRRAVGSRQLGDAITDSIENGTALTDRARTALRRALGDFSKGSEYATAIENL